MLKIFSDHLDEPLAFSANLEATDYWDPCRMVIQAHALLLL